MRAEHRAHIWKYPIHTVCVCMIRKTIGTGQEIRGALFSQWSHVHLQGVSAFLQVLLYLSVFERCSFFTMSAGVMSQQETQPSVARLVNGRERGN